MFSKITEKDEVAIAEIMEVVLQNVRDSCEQVKESKTWNRGLHGLLGGPMPGRTTGRDPTSFPSRPVQHSSVGLL